jgi:hypothetical protein
MAKSILYWALQRVRNKKDDHTQFVELHFLGSLWRWRYVSGAPYGVWALPSMRLRSWSTKTQEVRTVPNRGEPCCIASDANYFKGRVIREIERLIRTDEWRTHVRNVEAS